jgi:hypothetical protein
MINPCCFTSHFTIKDVSTAASISLHLELLSKLMINPCCFISHFKIKEVSTAASISLHLELLSKLMIFLTGIISYAHQERYVKLPTSKTNSVALSPQANYTD